MLRALLQEMFSEMVVKKDISVARRYYHADFRLETNGHREDLAAFIAAHTRVYQTAISYAVRYDDSAWVENSDKVAGRMWINTQRPDEPAVEIEVVLIATYAEGKILHILELTWPGLDASEGAGEVLARPRTSRDRPAPGGHGDWRRVTLLRSRPLLHRDILQDRRTVLPVEKFTDKGPPDILLVDRPERSWNQAPQRGKNAWRMRIPRNDAGSKNCQAPEPYAPDGVFLFADANIANRAPGAAAHCREKSEALEARCVAATRKCADHADFQLPHVRFAPLAAPFPDADA